MKILIDMIVVIWRGYFPEKLTEVSVDIYNGELFVTRERMIKQRPVHVANSIAGVWGLKRDKIEIYAYSLESEKEVDQYLEQGYYCVTSKGAREVVSFKQETVKKFKGERLKTWESRSIIQLRKTTKTT